MTFIVSFLALIFLILFHEFGHFLAARLNGVAVEKFSIGFGKKIFSFNWLGTEFIFSAIPLGGYVKMKSENPEDPTSGDEDEFLVKKWYQKISIAFAGPFANFVLAILVMILMFMGGRTFEDSAPIIGKNLNKEINLIKNDKIVKVNGVDVESWSKITENIKWNEENTFTIIRSDSIKTISAQISQQDYFESLAPKAEALIGEVVAGLPAYKAGLMEGDRVLSVNSKLINDWYEMRENIINSKNDNVKISYLRNGEEKEATLALQTDVIGGNKMIGVMQKLPIKIEENYTFLQSIKYGFNSTINMTLGTYYGIYKLIQKPASIKDNIGSPVMLFSVSKQTAKKGVDSMLTLFASISIMLMVMNLLPIPILDGGQIVFYVIEGIIRKPVSMKIQMIFQQIGFMFLISLMIFSFYSDFDKLFQRQKSINKTDKISE